MLRRTAVVAALLSSLLTFAAPAPAHAVDPGPLATWQLAELPLATGAQAYDATRGQLLVGVDQTVPVLGNHLVEVDPQTGAIGRSLLTPATPTTIDVSDDGTRAYVGFATAGYVVEVDLAAFQEVRRFTLGVGDEQPLVAGQVVVQPGRADVVAVVRSNLWYEHDVAIFEDGLMRPDTVGGADRVPYVTFGGTDQLFGADTHDLQELAIDATGVHDVPARPELDVAAPLDVHDGVLTAGNGKVYDLATNTLVGSYSSRGTFVIDHETGLAFILLSTGLLNRHDVETRALLDGRGGFPVSGRLVETDTGLVVATPSTLTLLGPGVSDDGFSLPGPVDEPIVRDIPPRVADVAAGPMVTAPDGTHVYARTTWADSDPGRIVDIDVATGEPLRSLPLGDEGDVAMSDDGTRLFATHPGRNVVTEIDTADLSIDREVTLPDVDGSPTRAVRVTPVPGSDDRYLVNLAGYGNNGVARGLALVDDGVVLADRVGPEATATHPVFGDDPTVAYAFGGDEWFTTLAVTPTGVEVTDRKQRVARTFLRNADWHDGRIYTSDGWVVEADAPLPLGRLSAGNAAVLVPDRDRILYLSNSQIGEYRLDDRVRVRTSGPAVGGFVNSAVLAGSSVVVASSNPAALSFVALTAAPEAPRRLRADPSPGAIELTWRAPADDGGHPVTSYRVYRDGVQIHETADGGTRQFLDTGRTDGTVHEYTVTAVNDLGEGPPSEPRSRASGGTDDVPPVITITTPTDGAEIAQDAAVTVDFSCTDDVSGADIECEGTIADGAPVPTDELGDFELTVESSDDAGNVATATVDYSVVDVTKPTVEITSPRAGQQIPRGATVRVRFTCADEAGGSGLADCDGSMRYDGLINTRRAGPQTLRVTATDVAGNTRVVNRSFRIVHPTCAGRRVTVVLALGERATNGPDVILGTNFSDDIRALGGNDLVCAGTAFDRVNGGAGNDRLLLGRDDDWGIGGEGNDVLEGQADMDLLEGGPGTDRLVGGNDGADDYCDGGSGTDRINGCEYIRRIP